MVKVQRTFLFYLLLILTLGMLLEIVIRYLFNQSIFGLSDFIGYTSVWLYAVGASYATHERSHIKAEFINAFVRSDKTRHIIRLVAVSVSTVMSAIFTKWSYDLCLYSMEIGEKTQAYPVPKVIFQASFFHRRHFDDHLFYLAGDRLRDQHKRKQTVYSFRRRIERFSWICSERRPL